MVEFEDMVHGGLDTDKGVRVVTSSKSDRPTVKEMKNWTPEQYERYVRSQRIKGFS